MSDIVERLRAAGHDERLVHGPLYLDAADEIERLYNWQRRAVDKITLARNNGIDGALGPELDALLAEVKP